MADPVNNPISTAISFLGTITRGINPFTAAPSVPVSVNPASAVTTTPLETPPEIQGVPITNAATNATTQFSVGTSPLTNLVNPAETGDTATIANLLADDGSATMPLSNIIGQAITENAVPLTGSASVAGSAALATGSLNPLNSSYWTNGFGAATSTLGTVMSSFTAVASVFGLYSSFKAIASGQGGVMNYVGAALSAYGAYGSLVPLLTMIGVSGPLAPFIAAAIIIVAIIAGFLGGKKKDQPIGAGDAPAFPVAPSDAAASTAAATTAAPSWLSSIPSSSLIFLSSGMALMGLGINLTATAPPSQILNVSSISLPAMHNAFQSDSGRSLPNGLVGDVFLLKGNDGQSDRAVIVSPDATGGGGNTLQVVTLDNAGNMIGRAAPNHGYIPLYTQSGNSPTGLTATPAAVNAIAVQNGALAISANSDISVSSRLSALNRANASNKDVTPAGNQ